VYYSKLNDVASLIVRLQFCHLKPHVDHPCFSCCNSCHWIWQEGVCESPQGTTVNPDHCDSQQGDSASSTLNSGRWWVWA